MRLIVLGLLFALAVFAVGCTGNIATPVPVAPAAVQKGSLRVSIETQGAAVSQIYTAGLKSVEMARVKFSAIGEDALVRDLVLDVINGNGNVERVILLDTGGSADFVHLIGGKASFHFPPGSEIRVPAYGSRVLVVAVDITQVGTLVAGQLVTLGVRDVFAVGTVSGATVSQETPGGTPAILMGNTMRMEEVEPVITLHPDSPSGFQAPVANQVVAMFTLTASGFRDLVFNGLTIEKAGNTSPHENVTAFSLWRDSDKLAEAKSTGALVYFTFAEQTVTAGASAVLTIRADTSLVRRGVSSGVVTFAVNIPGMPAPIGGVRRGGLSWNYTPLGTGTAGYKTEGDSYPVTGHVSTY